jgi:histidyl-tRNA synthetase
MKLSTKPPVGTQDRDPAEFRRRQYLFAARRRVCQRFGYEEYLTPLVEDKAIYEAKSGDEVGSVELTRITNKDGELTNLAIRPELTPSVTRLVSSQYRQLPKPIRWFAIPNFYRNEKPQK